MKTLMFSSRAAMWPALRFLGLIGLLLIPSPTSAYSGGPPNEKTGAPGEGTCHDCHNSFELNSGQGSLIITAPTEFEAGENYEIAVSLEQLGQSRWGFEFSPLDVGACAVTDPANTQLDITQGKTYVKHTSQGTHNGDPGPASWSFDWTAPVDPPLEITFYAAGNAANGNGSTDGDYVYTTSTTSTLMQTGADAPLPASMLALNSSPNPFETRTVISYQVPAAGRVSLTIYDSKGRLVASPYSGATSSGSHHVLWDGTDDDHHVVPAGIYFCRLSTEANNSTRRLVMVR